MILLSVILIILQWLEAVNSVCLSVGDLPCIWGYSCNPVHSVVPHTPHYQVWLHPGDNLSLLWKASVVGVHWLWHFLSLNRVQYPLFIFILAVDTLGDNLFLTVFRLQYISLVAAAYNLHPITEISVLVRDRYWSYCLHVWPCLEHMLNLQIRGSRSFCGCTLSFVGGRVGLHAFDTDQ